MVPPVGRIPFLLRAQWRDVFGDAMVTVAVVPLATLGTCSLATFAEPSVRYGHARCDY
jgi:hypothetical protein